MPGIRDLSSSVGTFSTGDDRRERAGILGLFSRFVRSEVIGSVILLGSTAAALAWANSPWAGIYEDLRHTKIGISWGGATFELSLQHWINDGLMAVFFFVVGLEIKREILLGQLSSLGRAVLPVAAALGGMAVPAALYLAVNAGGPGQDGWGVPMATDIAFALGALAVFGKRVPVALKVFLTALAIADDLGAVLVIALFYSGPIRLEALAAAGGILLGLRLVIAAGVRRPGVILFLVIGVWAAVFASGLHATIAGILAALAIPVRARIGPRRFFETVDRRTAELRAAGLSRESMVGDEAQLEALVDLQEASRKMIPMGIVFEEYLHPVLVFLILPLFALFNAGIPVAEEFLGTLESPVSLGVLLGLVGGKFLGILGFGWVAVRATRSPLPPGVTWGQLLGVGFLGGIGFTMSLFIAELAHADAALVDQAKAGILAASLASAVIGLLILRKALPRKASP